MFKTDHKGKYVCFYAFRLLFSFYHQVFQTPQRFELQKHLRIPALRDNFRFLVGFICIGNRTWANCVFDKFVLRIRGFGVDFYRIVMLHGNVLDAVKKCKSHQNRIFLLSKKLKISPRYYSKSI